MHIERKAVAVSSKSRATIPDFCEHIRKLLYGLAGKPIAFRPFSEPGGHATEAEVRALFYSGISSPNLDAWLTSLEHLLQSITHLRGLRGKIIHYTVMLANGERFTDATAVASLEILGDILGYGSGDDYLSVSFWHSGGGKPDHLHMVACRINIRDKSLLREHGGWLNFGLLKVKTKIQSVCGFSQSSEAPLRYREGEFLCKESAQHEEQTGEPSEERILKNHARKMLGDIHQGAIRGWDELLTELEEAGISYIMGPRGGTLLRSRSGFLCGISSWVPELSRAKLEACFGAPFPGTERREP